MTRLSPRHSVAVSVKGSQAGLSEQKKRCAIVVFGASQPAASQKPQKPKEGDQPQEILPTPASAESDLVKFILAANPSADVAIVRLVEGQKFPNMQQYTHIAVVDAENKVDQINNLISDLDKRWSDESMKGGGEGKNDGHIFLDITQDKLKFKDEDGRPIVVNGKYLKRSEHVTITAVNSLEVYGSLIGRNMLDSMRPFVPYTGTKIPVSSKTAEETEKLLENQGPLARDKSLEDGISTLYTSNGEVFVDRLITTNITTRINRDLETKHIVSYCKFAFRDYLDKQIQKFAFAKSAENATSTTLTKSDIKARMYQVYNHLKEAGYLEDPGGEVANAILVHPMANNPGFEDVSIPIYPVTMLRGLNVTLFAKEVPDE